MKRTVILGAARTPFGKFGGAAIREAIEHSIFGIVAQAETLNQVRASGCSRGTLWSARER